MAKEIINAVTRKRELADRLRAVGVPYAAAFAGAVALEVGVSADWLAKLRAAVEQIAEAKDRSVAWVVRDALTRYVEQEHRLTRP